MAFKVHIPSGETTVTVGGLFQWDYGQVLEIECSEIGSEIMEAHFACPNMTEAIVCTCTFSNGVGTVTIPNQCLEQANSVTVWIYKVDSTQGHTIKTIVLPITARTRPSNVREVPADYTDKYGQLIEEVNEAIDALEKGNITAAKSIVAKDAEHAKIADSATSATYATTAGSATIAHVKGNIVATATVTDGEASISPLVHQNLYIVVFNDGFGFTFSGMLYVASGVSITNVGGYVLRYYKTLEQDNGTVEIGSPDGTKLNGTLKFYKMGDVS